MSDSVSNKTLDRILLMDRVSRNIDQKRRRDRFNMLVRELGGMLNVTGWKISKSMVLKATVSFLKNHKETVPNPDKQDVQGYWLSSFLSVDELTHLIFESQNGFLIAFSQDGKIQHVSENVAFLLGHASTELSKSNIFNLIHDEDRFIIHNIFSLPRNIENQSNIQDWVTYNRVSFSCHIKRGDGNSLNNPIYQWVTFKGVLCTSGHSDINNTLSVQPWEKPKNKHIEHICIAVGFLQAPFQINEMCLKSNNEYQFTSWHTMDWKFLSLDNNAEHIIGIAASDVLGKSGYEYCHVDDLDNISVCHELLIQRGGSVVCNYRFLTKGQQWIWIQTTFFIQYDQNSMMQGIACTHRAISYMEMIELKRKNDSVTIS